MEQELQISGLQQGDPAYLIHLLKIWGPIPPGWYIIYPSEIEEGNVNFLEKKDDVVDYMATYAHYVLRNMRGDWGYYRVKIASSKTNVPK